MHQLTSEATSIRTAPTWLTLAIVCAACGPTSTVDANKGSSAHTLSLEVQGLEPDGREAMQLAMVAGRVPVKANRAAQGLAGPVISSAAAAK